MHNVKVAAKSGGGRYRYGRPSFPGLWARLKLHCAQRVP